MSRIIKTLQSAVAELDLLDIEAEGNLLAGSESYEAYSLKYESARGRARACFERAKEFEPSHPYVQRLIENDFEQRVSLSLPEFNFAG